MEYLKDLNGKRAAIRAGYKPANAEQQAAALLRLPAADAYIAKNIAEMEAMKIAGAERILLELKRIALTDLRQAYGEDGKLLPIREMPEDTARAVSSMETEELWVGEGEDRRPGGDVRKMKTWDKLRALELLAKYHGLLVERREVKVTASLEQLLTESFTGATDDGDDK